jgi:MFS transporter, SHS family, lactate transporter
VPKSLLVAQGRIAAVGRPDLSGLPSLFGSPLKFIFALRVAFQAASSFFLSNRGCQQDERAMSTLVNSSSEIPWWKEPTKDQWIAWIAAWLGWTLDAFDFTIFLLIMVPIAESFNVPLIEVTAVFTVTLWLRLVGAIGSGWLADRIGRKTPLMISILWYSICNFAAGLSPTFALLFLFRALLGIGMGAEWPAGAALAMESWPTRSRGLMSGVLQGSWSIGFLLSSLAYGLLYDKIGWRGLLMLGILPALAVIWIRIYVKEPKVWVENRQIQREQKKEFRAPLLDIFRPRLLGNTLMACLWMASSFIIYYAVYGMFATHLQKDLHLSAAMVAMPIALANLVGFLASGVWGHVADVWGRRWAMIVPAIIGAFVTAALSVHRFLRHGGRRLHCAGRFPRRNLWAESVLSVGTISDRGASDRIGLLLPPGGDLGRLHRPSADLLCRQSAARLHRPDADRDERRRRRLRHHPAVQPGDEGQGTRSAAHLGGGIVRRVTTKFNLRLGKELAHSVVRPVNTISNALLQTGGMIP